MKKQKVYMCSKGHLHYNLDEPPEVCNFCDSTEFGLIEAENMEDDDELPEES